MNRNKICKSFMISFILILSTMCLTGCNEAKKVEKATTVVLEDLQTDYGEEFVINDIKANKGSMIRGIKSYGGHAYPENDPSMVFSFNLTSNYQILKNEYLCVQLARKLDSKVRSAGKIDSGKYNIHTVVFSESQLVASEINIAPETVLNSGIIHYSVYLISEASNIKPEEEAEILGKYVSNLSSISFDGVLYSYYVKAGTTDKIIEAIDGKINPREVKDFITNSCSISCNKDLEDLHDVITQLTN